MQDGYQQVVVKDKSRNQPFLLIQVNKAGEMERKQFEVFSPVTPPDSVFRVPTTCPGPGKSAESVPDSL